MRAILIAVALVLSAAVAVPAVAHQGKGKDKRPSVIQLPKDFAPEGITTSKRHTFFVGSRTTGAIYKGSLRTGDGDILVAGGGGKQATGLKVDRFGRLFVSAAGSKVIRVYDADTGKEIRSYRVDDSVFVNDVVVTRRGAYFTDSQVAQLYFIPFGKQGALGELQRIPLTGDLQYDTDLTTFELNGIEAAKDGDVLISVQSKNGKLFAIDPATGDTDEIALEPRAGTDNELDEGDGLLLQGRRLSVVENQDNRVTVVKLSRNLSSGRIVEEIDSPRFNVPTTIARSGGRNYVVNAKFGSNTPDQTYEVVKVPRK